MLHCIKMTSAWFKAWQSCIAIVTYIVHLTHFLERPGLDLDLDLDIERRLRTRRVYYSGMKAAISSIIAVKSQFVMGVHTRRLSAKLSPNSCGSGRLPVCTVFHDYPGVSWREIPPLVHPDSLSNVRLSNSVLKSAICLVVK